MVQSYPGVGKRHCGTKFYTGAPSFQDDSKPGASTQRQAQMPAWRDPAQSVTGCQIDEHHESNIFSSTNNVWLEEILKRDATLCRMRLSIGITDIRDTTRSASTVSEKGCLVNFLWSSFISAKGNSRRWLRVIERLTN